VAGGERRLRDEDLHKLYVSPDTAMIIRVIKSRRMTWTRFVSIRTIFWSENLKGRNQSEDLAVDGKIILNCILRKQVGKVWTGCSWFRAGASGGVS
jgi:hypothetical protein